jgi:hypothetical protein
MLSMVAGAAPKSMDEAAKKRYQFWETQPVPRISKCLKECLDKIGKNGNLKTSCNGDSTFFTRIPFFPQCF